MTDYESCRKILMHYGIANQLKKLVEEMNELGTVIKNQGKYPKTAQFRRALHDEIADVEVVLEQIKIHFGSHTVVDSIKEHKVQRTLYEIEIEDE